MNHDMYPDAYLRDILGSVRTIAMVGASPKESRPSHQVMKYLLARGFRVIPVNPGQADKEILGQRVYSRLSDIPEQVDMVDIFRASQAAGAVVDEALSRRPPPDVVWMQIGVRDDAAAARAEAAGTAVVMNRCPKIEYARLSGELAPAGVSRRPLSSRKAPRTASGFQRLAVPPVADPVSKE